MRFARLAFMAVMGTALLLVSLANRGEVTLRLLPEEILAFAGQGWALEMPLFLVVFIGICLGLVIGFLWEWMRERRWRSLAIKRERENRRLSDELKSLRSQRPDSDDLEDMLD